MKILHKNKVFTLCSVLFLVYPLTVCAQDEMTVEDAIKIGVEKAAITLTGIRGAWVQEQTVIVEDGKVTEFRVNMKVSFILED